AIPMPPPSPRVLEARQVKLALRANRGKKPRTNGEAAKQAPDSKTDAKADAKADAKPDAKPDAKADTKPDAKPDTKTAGKTDGTGTNGDKKHGCPVIPGASPSSCLSQATDSHSRARRHGSHRRDACGPARPRHRWFRDRATAARTRPFPGA